MPHHYVLHKLKAHPKYNHTKRRLSHFSKTHPKIRSALPARLSSLFSNNPTHEEVRSTMQGEGIHHKKRLHPLKFKI